MPRGRGHPHYVYMCARKGRAGGEDRETKTGGGVVDDEWLGRTGPGRTAWKESRPPIVGQFPPETKHDRAGAGETTGTGTVEWRSAPVGTDKNFEGCPKGPLGLTCPP